MGAIINWNNKEILKSSTGVIESLCEYIVFTIYEDEIVLSNFKELKSVLLSIFPGCEFDLADYIHTKKDLKLFIKVARRAIDMFYEIVPELPEFTKIKLENFYKQLLEIQKSLS